MIPKFRFFDTEENKMHIVDSLYTFKSFGGKDITIATEDIDLSEWRSYSDGVLMQSTGLKDKIGTEIFVGDILEYEMVMGFGWYENGKDVVVYDENELKIKMKYRNNNSLNRVVAIGCEVVGNKYEHPYLLKE